MIDPLTPGSGPGDRPPARRVVGGPGRRPVRHRLHHAGPAPAQAADLREFNPGNIITDQVFFDEGSMTPGAVQAFLDDKGSSCVRGADGTACLRAYRMDTSSRSATTYCPVGYQGASQETAATIIYKVAQACRVNPQVLIVTLQKEMGLVRTTNPTAKMYSRAMGYGCPDNSTGVCNSAYYGLQNQLYSAASQYQRYVKNPTNYSYRAGITNYILYHPYNDCRAQVGLHPERCDGGALQLHALRAQHRRAQLRLRHRRRLLGLRQPPSSATSPTGSGPPSPPAAARST